MASSEKDLARLSDFIAVGPQRTGTTWLHEVLKAHVGLPRGTKETDFFLKNYSNGIGWYREYFRGYPAEMPVGEVDPNYFAEDSARERIAALIPQCKIICTFRDPVERIYSCYRVMRRDVWTRAGFEETVSKNRLVREGSRYAYYLVKWQETFGKESVLVCLYDDLETAPQQFVDRICDFLGIARINLDDSRLAAERVNTVTHAPRSRKLAQNARNARDWMRLHRWHRTAQLLERTGVWRFSFGGGEEFGPLDVETDLRLRAQFLSEIEALEKIIGRDLSRWKAPNRTAAPAGSRIGTRASA